MGNFRTSSLFHYTKYNHLKQILVEGFTPNYCSEDLSTEGTQFVLGIPMVCFCDIPLTRTEEFTSRYGKHAIGLNKEWARNRLNPIMYVKDEAIIISLRFFRSYELALQQKLSSFGSDGHSISFDLNNPASVSNIVPFINHINATAANRKLFGYMKKYTSEWMGKPLVNYEENEWRYVIEESLETPWYWTRDEYMAWRGNVNSPKPTPILALKSRKLTFTPKDVTHIIVEKEYQVSSMVDFIEKKDFRNIGGSETLVTEDDKKVLISRIISMERIAKDF